MGLIKIGGNKKEKQYAENYRKAFDIKETNQEKLVREKKAQKHKRTKAFLLGIHRRIVDSPTKKTIIKTRKYKYTTRRRIYEE